jgi:hypothetical protein
MASKNDVAIAWQWISIFGKLPSMPAAPPASPAPPDNAPEKGDDPESFEEDSKIARRLWPGTIQ